MFIYARFALRAGSERFLRGKVRCFLAVQAVTLTKIEFGAKLSVKFQRSGEWPAHLAAKTGKRADSPLGDQFRDFLRRPFAPGNDFPHAEVAGQALEFSIILLHQSAAFGARRIDGRKSGVGDFAVPDPVDQIPSRIGDVQHELVAGQPTLFHFLELVFPFAGQFW